MPKTLTTMLLACSMLAPIAGVAMPGLAAAADTTTVEEITVTARKREENLQDSPLSISALSADTLQRKGVDSLAAVAALTPGLQFDRGLSENDVRPVIRGISSIFGRPSVAVLMDGVDTSGSAIVSNGGGALMNSRLADIERVEVIRGPQSALYGRNAFAGAINYVTKKPTAALEAGVTADLASYGLYDLSGYVSGPIAGDVLRGRLNVAAHKFDGFYDNQTTGHKVGQEDSVGVRAQLEYLPNDAFDALLRVEYSTNHETQGAAVLDTYNTVSPGGFKYYSGAVIANPANIKYIGDPKGLDGKTLRSSLDLKYDFGPATLTSTTSYVWWRASQADDVGYSFLPALAAGFSVRQLWDAQFKTRQWSEDLRLTSNGDTRLKYLVGVYAFSEFSNAVDQTQAYFGSCANFLAKLRPGVRCAGADGFPNAPFVNSPDGYEQRQTTHYSIYGALDYAITDKLTASAELRVGRDKIEASHLPFQRSFALLGFGSFDGGPFTSANFLASGGYVAPAMNGMTVKSNATNPRFSVNYKVSPDIMVYGSFAKGTKPGGVSQILGTDNYAVNTYRPEKLYAYELGLKSELFAHRLQTNIALFQSRYKDQQTPYSTQVVTPTGSLLAVTGITNAGSVDTKGIELSSALRVSPSFDLAFNWAHTISEYDQFLTADTAAKALLAGNLAGKPVPSVPKDSWNLQARWQHAAWNGVDYFIEGTETYVGDRHANGDAASTIIVPSYYQADLQLGLKGAQWTLTGYAKNLFDDDTPRSALRYVNIASASASDQAVIVYLANPRQVGLRLNYRY